MEQCFFGCAFLTDESTDSFIWLFETFLRAMGCRQPKSIFTDQDQAMGGRQPKSIFTDQDQVMANAIKAVFSKARHRLCS